MGQQKFNNGGLTAKYVQVAAMRQTRDDASGRSFMALPVQVRRQVGEVRHRQRREVQASGRQGDGQEKHAQELVHQPRRRQALGPTHRGRLVAVVAHCNQQHDRRQPPAQPIRHRARMRGKQGRDNAEQRHHSRELSMYSPQQHSWHVFRGVLTALDSRPGALLLRAGSSSWDFILKWVSVLCRQRTQRWSASG